jgi:hypothetical protein
MGEFPQLSEKAHVALSDYAQLWITPCKRSLVFNFYPPLLMVSPLPQKSPKASG